MYAEINSYGDTTPLTIFIPKRKVHLIASQGPSRRLLFHLHQVRAFVATPPALLLTLASAAIDSVLPPTPVATRFGYLPIPASVAAGFDSPIILALADIHNPIGLGHSVGSDSV